MRTFLAANLGLAPFLAFWIGLALASPPVAAAVALGFGLTLAAWRAAQREFVIVEAGGVAVFVALGFFAFIAPGAFAVVALPASFFGLGFTALASVALGRPWTADYARAAFAAEAESPVFHAVNMLISGFWAVLFMFEGAAAALHAGPLVSVALFGFGALVSIVGPKTAIRAILARAIRARETYRWPAPAFPATGGEIDVAVVGAGLGGLTAAALLADAGLKVAVFDAHVAPGGYCHSFLRKARWRGRPVLYRFDAGPHDFSGVFPGGPLKSVLERLAIAQRVTWRRLDHSYRLDGSSIDPPRDWRAYARALGERFPADAAGLAALFEDIYAIYAGMYATGRGRGGIPGAAQSVDAMLAFLRAHPLAARWMDRPFAELVATHVKDARARRVVGALAGYVTDRGDGLTCGQMVPLFGYYFNGGYYPVGGSGVVADALVAAIEARGGGVRLKTRVARILAPYGRACGLALASGERVAASAVVANSDFRRTILELVESGALPAEFLARVAAGEPAASAFMVHLGVDFDPEVRPSIHLDAPMRMGVQVLSRVDPTAAPQGHATIGLIALVSQDEARAWFPAAGGDDWKAWRFSDEYEARKRAFGDRMIGAAEAAIPGLRDHIVYRSEASPVTYARYDLASGGAIYGLAGAPPLRGAKSPLAGLVIAGAATHGPGAEAGVISGAEAAEALLPGLLAGRNRRMTDAARHAPSRLEAAA